MPNTQITIASGILKGIGAPVTSKGVATIIGWAKAEGGSNWARNNPLNTTEGGPGVTATINSAGVKGYANPQSGISATVRTLMGGSYNGIVHALKTGQTQLPEDELNTWGTGALANQTIASTLGQHFNVNQSLGAAPARSGLSQAPSITNSRIPGATVASVGNTLDQPAYNQALKAYQLGTQLKSLGTAQTGDALGSLDMPHGSKDGLTQAQNPLFTTGQASTTAPNPSDYMTAQMKLQQLAGGTKLTEHPAAADNQVAGQAAAQTSGDASKLMKMIQQVTGAPYNQGNHSDISENAKQIKSQGTDCSGLISWLMGPSGLNLWQTSLATPSIADAPGLQAGKGKTVTVWNNKQAGNSGHVFIQIGNQFFASEGGVGIHQLSQSEAANYIQHGSDGGTYQALHPKGL